jgi:hypothetical protein
VRAVRRVRRNDDGVVAVIVALVLAFAMIPALALGTGTYVRSVTNTEQQRAADSGALAGASQIPLGDINFAEKYIASIPAGGVVSTTLQNLGIQNSSQLPDPLKAACDVALADAQQANNLAVAYSTYNTSTWCKAEYMADAGVLGSAQTCLNSIAGLNNITGLLRLLLQTLGLGALDPTKLLTSLQGTLPALLEPGVKVTTTWHTKAPFDQVFGSDGSTQTSVAYARRLFKNAVVLPNIPLGGTTTVNVNPTLQLTRTALLNTLNSVKGVLQTLNAVVPGVGTCAAIIDNLSGDLADAVNPPDNGPSLTQILDDAYAAGSPVLAVSTTVVGLGIPFLDMVPVCLEKVGNQYVAHLTSFASCIINAPGAFRAALRNS